MSNLNMTMLSLYENLRGADFSTPPSMVDKNRSPDCLNLMPDKNGNPVKRPGWQTKYHLEGRVNGLWHCTIDGTRYMLCHCGSRIYLLGDTPVVLMENVADGKGCGFYATYGEKGGFYILTTSQYLVFDGTELKRVDDDAYIPLVSIARTPSGAGVSYEDINLIMPKRRESFTGTENDLVYQLGADVISLVDKVEVMTADGGSETLTEDVDYTVNKALGQVVFTQPHPTPLTGHDNITVTYTKRTYKYADRIFDCTVSTMYGIGGDNRVFVSGNPDYPNRDWWSEVNNPTYFPDLSYAVVGSGQTAVMGYVRLGGSLGIVKQHNGQDPALFMRTGYLDDDGRGVFVVESGTNGTGAVSKRSFALVNDEPLFLSDRGVMAVVTNTVTSQHAVANRSWQVDGRLLAENNLADAACCVWKNFYLVATGDSVYLLDTRRIVRNNDGNGTRYEGYYWNNVPATAVAPDGEGLWFGTEDGRVCCFKDTDSSEECYSDDGAPIKAVWTTPVEDEGRIDRFKTICRRGCVATFIPFENSSVKVHYSLDGKPPHTVQEKPLDISAMFGRVDFSRITFLTGAVPREVYFYTRKKRYKRIQIVFENNVAGEGFGIHKFTKRYRIETYSKNRR